MGQSDDKKFKKRDSKRDDIGINKDADDDFFAMEDIEDAEIQLLIDGELRDLERIVLANRINQSPYARERLEELTDQKNLLRAWWRRQM